MAHPKDWAPLNSKGSAGGTYTLIDPESETGDWIYRVVDVDRQGRNTVSRDESCCAQSRP